MAASYSNLNALLGIRPKDSPAFGGMGISNLKVSAPTDEMISKALIGQPYTVDEYGNMFINSDYNPVMGNTALNNQYGYTARDLYERASRQQSDNPVLPFVNLADQAAYNQAYDDYWGSWGKDLDYLRNAPIAQKNTGGGNADLLKREMTMLLDGTIPGLSYGNKSGNDYAQIERMVPDLARFGVQSLFDIQAVPVPDPSNPGGTTTLFYDKRNGRIIQRDFGSSMKGKGGSNYYLNNAGPLAIPSTEWRDTSERDVIAGVLSVLSLAAAPAAIGALQGAGMSAAAAGGTYGAASGALNSAVSGNNVLQGALVGGATGYLGGKIGGGEGQLNIAKSLGVDNATAANLLNSAIKGGVTGGLTSLSTGRDLGESVLSGALSKGIQGGLAQYIGGDAASFLGNKAASAVPNSLVDDAMKKFENQIAARKSQAQQMATYNPNLVRSSGGGDFAQGVANYKSLNDQRRGRVDTALDKMYGSLAPVYKLRYT